jgi:hypothetical protein
MTPFHDNHSFNPRELVVEIWMKVHLRIVGTMGRRRWREREREVEQGAT